VGPDGTLFISDSRNHRIRALTPAREVVTLAGGGDPGGPGGRADGPGESARFRYPSGVAAAADGTLYIADTGNHRICRLRAGQVTTLAGGQEGHADGTGPAARFRSPAAMTVTADGAVWVIDAGSGRVRRVSPEGAVTTPEPPAAVLAALGVRKGGAVRIMGSEEGQGQPILSDFTMEHPSPGGEAAGLRVFGDVENHVVMTQRGSEPPLLLGGRRVKDVITPGSTDGVGHRSSFAVPCAAVIGKDGAAYVAEYEGNRIRRITLPEWLTEGNPAPEERRGRGFGRFGERRRFLGGQGGS
jgi:hypothetical protein